MKLGKLSAVFGLLAILCVLINAISSAGDHSVSGPITNLVSEFVPAEGEEGKIPELHQSNFFDINDPNIRYLLSILAIVVSILAGTIAVIAAKCEQNSLWYSVGIFAAISALSEISYILAGVYALVFAILVLRGRKWKMTAA